MATPDEINELLDMLGDYYGNAKDMNSLKRGLYVQALADLDAAILMDAAAEYIKTGKWFPKVSELRDIASVTRPEAFIADDVRQEELYQIHARFWEMQSLWMRGEITEREYLSDRAVAYCKRHATTQRVDDPAAWEWAQQVSEQWMVEDCGPNWRNAGAMMQAAEVQHV